MSEPIQMPPGRPTTQSETTEDDIKTRASSVDDTTTQGPPTPYLSSNPGSPWLLSRNSSYTSQQGGLSGLAGDDFSDLPPPEKLTFFDLFENLSLPDRIERWQNTLTNQREKIKRQREKIQSSSKGARDRAMAELKRRVPTAEEQLTKYRSRMKDQWMI